MLARRLTTILSAMSLAEAIETTRIHSVAYLTIDCAALIIAHLGQVPP
jgi:predicted ATPase with chaperone activity